VQPHSEMVCTVGQRSHLSIQLANQSLQPLRNLVLSIKFYQDYLNGMENYNLETRVAISGPNRWAMDQKINTHGIYYILKLPTNPIFNPLELRFPYWRSRSRNSTLALWYSLHPDASRPVSSVPVIHRSNWSSLRLC